MSATGNPRRFSRGYIDCHCDQCRWRGRNKRKITKGLRLAEKRFWTRERHAEVAE